MMKKKNINILGLVSLKNSSIFVITSVLHYYMAPGTPDAT